MRRKTLIAGNWKMHKNRGQARELAHRLLSRVEEGSPVEVALCPPFTALSTVAEVLEGSPIRLGAQDMCWEDEGAFTGEISPGMLLDCGCHYVIIGHSERRQFFHESDETVHRKLKKVLGGRLAPILCVGESLEEREGGRVEVVIRRQLEGALREVPEAKLSNLVLAYEPVWAIGTGKTATPETAETVHAMIRRWMEDHFSPTLAEGTRILYGGSVKPENARELMAQGNLDGALVGGASLQAESFARIIEEAGAA